MLETNCRMITRRFFIGAAIGTLGFRKEGVALIAQGGTNLPLQRGGLVKSETHFGYEYGPETVIPSECVPIHHARCECRVTWPAIPKSHERIFDGPTIADCARRYNA